LPEGIRELVVAPAGEGGCATVFNPQIAVLDEHVDADTSLWVIDDDRKVPPVLRMLGEDSAGTP
jgi:hypothetical protein